MKWLLEIESNKITGELLVGNEVTVHGEMTGEDVNTDSFWGVTTRVLGSDKYEVKMRMENLECINVPTQDIESNIVLRLVMY